jgi:hypothetical protein
VAKPATATCLPVARGPGNGIMPAGFSITPNRGPAPGPAKRGYGRNPLFPTLRHWRQAQTDRAMPPPQGIVTLS